MNTIDADLDTANSRIAELIARHAPIEGVHATPIPAVSLIRSNGVTEPLHVLYRPALCMIAQGAKQLLCGDRIYEYDAARYLVVSVDLPIVGHVIRATPDAPYLCVSLDIDTVALAAMSLDQAPLPEQSAAPGLSVSPSTAELADAMLRLLRLLDCPADIAFLAPMIEREIYYRLMLGEQGAAIRRIANADSKLAQISRAIAWIKRHYAKPMRIEEVAAEARMGVSAFHLYFKGVTHMSPLQYQKQLRLQEARRLMLGQALDAAQAGFEVGYESASQFNREYSRLFGAPPARDAARLRAQPSVMLSA